MYSIFSPLCIPLSLALQVLHSHTKIHTEEHKDKKAGGKKTPYKQKRISERMMMEQLCENSLPCPFAAYQVAVWRRKFYPMPSRTISALLCQAKSGLKLRWQRHICSHMRIVYI